MKKIIIIVTSLLLSVSLFSQSIEDIGKIVVGVKIMPNSSVETKNLQDLLKNKLSQLATQAGYSALGTNNIFNLSPNIIINSTDVAEGGMKNIYLIKGELYLSIQEAEKGIVYSSVSFPFKGSATTKDRAVRNAIVDITYTDIRQCFDEAKAKILRYYETQQDVIFSRANTYLANNQFDEAITCLLSIPTELSSLYQKSLAKANEVYKLKKEEEQRQLAAEIEQYNNELISKANSYLAMHESKKALLELGNIVIGNKRQDAIVSDLRTKAENNITENERKEYEAEQQRIADSKERAKRDFEAGQQREQNNFQLRQKQIELEIKNTALEQERVNALRSIALAYILKDSNNN